MTPNPHISILSAAPTTGDSIFVGILLASGVGLITFVLLRKLFKRRKREHLEYETPQEKIERITSQGMPRDRIETLMVEAQELTRVCAAQIESKAAVLESLIAIADDRIARLEEVDANPSSAAPGNPAITPERNRPPPATTPTDPLTRKVYELADSGSESLQIARELDEQVGKVDLILALRAH